MGPQLTHADLKSACLRMLRLLTESKYSWISGRALEVSLRFLTLAVGPPGEAVSSSRLKVARGMQAQIGTLGRIPLGLGGH